MSLVYNVRADKIFEVIHHYKASALGIEICPRSLELPDHFIINSKTLLLLAIIKAVKDDSDEEVEEDLAYEHHVR